ncbi:XRCC4-like factor-domain-containing protein [Ilyonectria robusta]|uniref:XRCC4-like factor-domain-containing protein n=1 Tax=Ilyonectria robusta TaxID=1079257 RepID=UPI001E8E08B2|nr:XRCC4-like factor-domain-containing protein [Ilyonectria robusta]KAH8734654.1 XRCC4-like factor-domain-containing protein [Ilyonectria robusta]
MSPTKSWRPLPLPSSSDMPVLLVSIDIDTAAYTVHVTDMANMWTESLDRKAICIRGWSENTSIDPSDTPDNMVKFLTSIKSALDSSQPGHDQTRLRLNRASKSDAGDEGLTLQITCELPGLQPLTWPMHLKKSPSSAIAKDLVLPLVQAHLTRHQEVDSLVRMLDQKDAVLNKLLDKLDAMGTGLEHVFNPLSGKKKVSRTAAADKVPGLAPFNRRRWKSDVTKSGDDPSDTESLVKAVFGGEGLHFEPAIAIEQPAQLDQWWQDFLGVSSTPRPSQEKADASKATTPPPADGSLGVDDDDFQVQSTPPGLTTGRKSTIAKTEPLPDDVSTEEEPDSPEPVRNTRIIPSETRQPESKKPASRLGMLGRKKQSPPARAPSPVPSPPKTRGAIQKVDDSETASEAEDDGATASLPDDDQPPSSPPPPPKPAPKKGGLGLGRIGGPKAKQPAMEPAETHEPDAGETSAQPATRPAPRKLGMIGKKKGSDTGPVVPVADEGRGRSRGPVVEEEPSKATPRETSQERADRKREELKRELEKKAAAGPVKKKRKF